MGHIHKDVLGIYAIDPTSIANRLEVEQHLSACAVCTEVLRDIRSFDAQLRDPDVWSGSAKSPSEQLSELRDFAVRAAAEDTVAAELLKGFQEPNEAAHFAWINVSSRPEYKTGGVARRLCKMAHAMLERDTGASGCFDQ
jgi:hypothetical protein